MRNREDHKCLLNFFCIRCTNQPSCMPVSEGSQQYCSWVSLDRGVSIDTFSALKVCGMNSVFRLFSPVTKGVAVTNMQNFRPARIPFKLRSPELWPHRDWGHLTAFPLKLRVTHDHEVSMLELRRHLRDSMCRKQ